MKKFFAVISLLTFATIAMAADHKSLGDTEMCVTFTENNLKPHALSYFYYKMRDDINDLQDIKGMLDLRFRKLDPVEATAEGYDFSLELCGSDEAIVEAHAQLNKLAQSLVVVEETLCFSRSMWEFLRLMQQKFRADQGSITMTLLPSTRSNQIKIYLVAVQQRKDLAEFVLSGIIKQNLSQITFAYQENQSEKIQAYFRKFKNSIIANGLFVCVDNANRIIYFISMDDAGKKWCDHLNNSLNN